MNAIANCPVTIGDMNLAEEIFGKDIPTLKGKMMRRKPTPVVHSLIEIPPELIEAQHAIDLCFDTIYVNGLAFLMTISKRIMYCTVVWIKERTPENYRSALNKVFIIYQRAGFKVARVHCDNEFIPAVKLLQEDHPGLEYNEVSVQEHVSEVERNNRTIKEQICVAFHNTPFHSLP